MSLGPATMGRSSCLDTSRFNTLKGHKHRHRKSCTAHATFKGCTSVLNPAPKVVGMGSAGVDFMALVAAFPKPDQKLRTDKLEVTGGGNCANALTAAARLGVAATLVSKIGQDGPGDSILSELHGDGVDTTHVLRQAGSPSPFTYIIVDREGGTRTCIHTPGPAFTPDEMTSDTAAAILEGASLVYFDGRLTEAALLLAQAARDRGLPILVEAERLRPNLELLLAQADYVVTSAHFPQEWTGEAVLSDAILAVAERLPTARFIITTRGSQGSTMLERSGSSSDAGSSSTGSSGGGTAPMQSLEAVMASLSDQLTEQQTSSSSSSSIRCSAPSCISKNGVAIQVGFTAATPGCVQLQYTSSRDPEQARKQASIAASRAAALNADAKGADGYGMSSTATAAAAVPPVVAKVTMATIAGMPKEAVVDTTGAGDSFIGTVLYGLATGMSPPRMLTLAAVVAACKCTALGARPGLPYRTDLAEELL